MLEILTPLNKCERVSRQIAPATFVAKPGEWAQVESDGSLINVEAGVNAKINKLVIGSASSNQYESHDVEVGRITSMESHGIRCKVDTVGFHDVVSQGDELVVSSASDSLGKLMSVNRAASGTYEVVARAEEVNLTTGYLIFRTVSPYMKAVSHASTSASASASPSASVSASPS